MVVGQASKPILEGDFSIARDLEAMERMPRNQWPLESGEDKSPCAVPMMIYRDAFKSSSQVSPVDLSQKCAASESQLSLPSDFDIEIKDAELCSSSSTATLTNNSWENGSVDGDNNYDVVVNQEEIRAKGNSVDQISIKTNGAHVKSSRSLQHPSVDQNGAHLSQRQQKDFTPYLDSVNPLETSSGISVASEGSDSTSSSMESRIFYQDHEKSLSKHSVSDSAASSCGLSVANFIVSSGNLTPGLINTAYSRLKDRDMLYRKRIKELEKEVKKVPILEMKLATMKEENHLLLLQLKFCSGKTRTNGIDDNFPYNYRTYGSSNSVSKHLNDNNKCSGSFANSSGSSVASEIRNLELPCEKTSEMKCSAAVEKTTRSQISKPGSPEMANNLASKTLNGPKQNCELKEETHSRNKEDVKHQMPKLFDFSAHHNSTNLDKDDKQPRFCLKCPRCFFRISDESLATNIRKDQNVQTDPSIFTLERSTQTSGSGMLKYQTFECFTQSLEKMFYEIGLNNSKSPTGDQILHMLQYVAHHISDDSRHGCNASGTVPPWIQLYSKLRDSFSSEYPSRNTSDAIDVPVRSETPAVHNVEETYYDTIKKNNRFEMLDSCFDKTQKENNQVKDFSAKKMKINHLEVQNSDKTQVKNIELHNATVNQELVNSSHGSALKAKKEFRSVMLNHVPTSPFLPSSGEHRTAVLTKNERLTSCSSQISELADYDTQSFSTEDERNEKFQTLQCENGLKQMYGSSDHNDERQNVGALDVNSKNNDPKYDRRQDITVKEDIKLISGDSNCHTTERIERCHSPYYEMESSNNSDVMSDIAKEQKITPKESAKHESQVFEVEDIEEELIFPDEVKTALQRINEYLLNPKENPDRKSMRDPVDLVKKHWFGVTCSSHASTSLLQKYLNVVSQYSSALSQWVINLHDAFGNSILHFTVANKRLAMLDALLTSGICDVNKRNKAGFTAVMLASVNKLQSDLDRQVTKKLLQMSDLNAQSYENGETALTLASGHGVEDMVELLLEAGADVNVQDNDGSTALMYAAEHGFVDIARRLLVHLGCDLSLKDHDGMDACCVALKAGYPNLGLLIYFHASDDRGQFSGKKSGKCKKLMKMTTKNSARHFSRGSALKAIPDRA